MDKRNKIIYWIVTGALSLMMIMSAGMYFVKTAEVTDIFVSLGYNGRIVIPLAILKIVGIIAILTKVSKTLKEWAYFGFLLDFVLALEGHLAANDGGHLTAIIAIILWSFSYMYDKKVFSKVN
ncbi:DoxX family protein [Ekhidna sp. To15]|uniref:DoxX family protein n=1 Tax=Ekhidna sp. To15 TaxID=3395267 RepID=UPI003F525034